MRYVEVWGGGVGACRRGGGYVPLCVGTEFLFRNCILPGVRKKMVKVMGKCVGDFMKNGAQKRDVKAFDWALPNCV